MSDSMRDSIGEMANPSHPGQAFAAWWALATDRGKRIAMEMLLERTCENDRINIIMMVSGYINNKNEEDCK